MTTANLPTPEATVPTAEAPIQIVSDGTSCCGGSACGSSQN